MPIFEEKLISPLAIRFTQQRIRETFKDGHEIEATITQMRAVPGHGDYDIILEVPFPSIEIIRWSEYGRSAGGEDHWFSFDNRRLYCLQRVAAEYWPKRVGVIVEVLYADSGTIRKKLDSRTHGLSVSIGHAFAAEDELQQWVWRQAVLARSPPGCFALEAEAAVSADDSKASVCELTDATAGPSSFQKSSCGYESKVCEIPAQAQIGGNREQPCTETTLPPSDNPLTALIGQLLTSEAHTAEKEQTSSTTESPPDNSLSALIGHFLELKTQEQRLQPVEHVSDDAHSTCMSEHAETADTEVGTMSEPATSSPSAASCETNLASASDEEEQVPKNAPASDEEEQVPKHCHATPTKKQQLQDKSVTKDCHSKPKGRNQVQRVQAARAELHMAQCQMAQWQMASWQSSQMAQWQQASFHLQARAAQAAQAAQWQRAQETQAAWY